MSFSIFATEQKCFNESQAYVHPRVDATDVVDGSTVDVKSYGEIGIGEEVSMAMQGERSEPKIRR